MKVPRKNPLKGLPSADPLADKPTSGKRTRLGDEATQSLLPSWYHPKPASDTDPAENAPTTEALFDEKQWEEFVDRNPAKDAADESPLTGQQLGQRKSVLEVLAEGQAADAPQVYANQTRRNVVDREDLPDVPHGTNLERLRAIGLRLAEERGAPEPSFQRARAEGLGAKDWPPPGSSFGMLGFRGSGGRSMQHSTRIEADRLYESKNDKRHGTSVGNLHSAPLKAELARQMMPGERYRIFADRATLVDSGAKYTIAPFGLLSSSPVHDVGPYAQAEAVTAVEGDAVIEVVGGTDQNVGVTVALGKERTEPLAQKSRLLRRMSKDGNVRIGAGLFLDGSLADLFLSKLAEDQVAQQFEDINKRKSEIDLALTPHLEGINRATDASLQFAGKRAEEQVTAYELKFDLKKEKAREIFDKIVGTGDKPGIIDFSALEDLPEDSGVTVVANHVRNASRKGTERTLRLFGYESHKANVSEHIDKVTESKRKGRIHTVEKNEGLVRRRRRISNTTESTLVARIKSEHDEKQDKRRSGVGLGWRMTVDDTATSVDEVSGLLSFAAVADPDGKAPKQLEELRNMAGSLPRAKLLGLPIREKGIGRSKAELSVELNADATRRLLSHVKDPEKTQALWDRLAHAYAVRHQLDEAPPWPMERLNGDGWFDTFKRNFTAFGREADGFLLARQAVELLTKAAEAEDPQKQGQAIVQAFDVLSTDMYLAGALIDVARGGADDPDLEISFSLKGERFSPESTKVKKPAPAPAAPKEVVPEGESKATGPPPEPEPADDPTPETIVESENKIVDEENPVTDAIVGQEDGEGHALDLSEAATAARKAKVAAKRAAKRLDSATGAAAADPEAAS